MIRHALTRLGTVAALAALQVVVPGPTSFGLIGVGMASLGVELIQRSFAET